MTESDTYQNSKENQVRIADYRFEKSAAIKELRTRVEVDGEFYEDALDAILTKYILGLSDIEEHSRIAKERWGGDNG